jgi:superfamily II DNA or RNA helicase
MDDRAPEGVAAPTPPLAPGSHRKRTWRRFLRGPDPSLLDELYIPALAEAIRYDRCCAYFSSSVLAAAARGFGALIERLAALGPRAPRPAVRLLINEELSAEDARALTETGDTRKLEALLEKRLRTPQEVLEKRRLAMLGWLVKQGLLEVRVGIMRHGEGIVHAKFGMMMDEAGDAVVFSGSGNESAQGLLGNYEELEVSTSWGDANRHEYFRSQFESLWGDEHPDVHTLSLPEALRLKLVKLAPREAPVVEPTAALERQKGAMAWSFAVEAPFLPNGAAACDATAMVDPWPHQRRVIEEAANAWPDGRLLCDEVGMGKTIEAILILRRLLAGRGVRRALILVPAGLLRQWQAELREKGGLIVPRLEGTNKLVWPDDREEAVESLGDALKRDLSLMSRETARTERNLPLLLEAPPWDLVILDESHAARRRQLEVGEFNRGTLLLNLLRALQLRRRARGILLLSATPMQTHPVEPWDLLGVLGEGGAWLAGFEHVRDFYGAIAAVKDGGCDLELARRAAVAPVADPQFPTPPGDSARPRDVDSMAKRIVFSPASKRQQTADWLRGGSPMTRRMHRNTRGTLVRYYEQGLLAQRPPARIVEDEHFDFLDGAERRVYNAVGHYIERRFRELESEKAGKGFVMTVYRRRASSSPRALEQSLERRREGLTRVIQRKAYDFDLTQADVPEALDLDDLPDEDAPAVKVSASLPEDPEAARRELHELEPLLAELRALRGRDSKRDRFFDLLRSISEDGRPVLVFTEYVDTMEYLRDQLMDFYRSGLGCYSGGGGQLWSEEGWKPVTKDAITIALRDGGLRVLLCTDAASEGLNLQAAGAVINYDLPWNPSRVEQRIGRVDRIGQRLPEVKVVNLFLKDSVDDQVYRALRVRCGLFEHFVGAMQPVLALARKMLEGARPVDVGALEGAAQAVERDPMAAETYGESGRGENRLDEAPVRRTDLVGLMGAWPQELGPRVRKNRQRGGFEVSGTGLPKARLGGDLEVLEHDRTVFPLNPEAVHVAKLVETLTRTGERLPLVIGSFRSGAFRSSVAYWALGGKLHRLESLVELEGRLSTWTGEWPAPEEWLDARRLADSEAEQQVHLMARRAEEREAAGLARQLHAARLRLHMELGRYLVCLEEGAYNLSDVLRRQMERNIDSAVWLREAVNRLGEFPSWAAEECRELERYAADLTDAQRKAQRIGKGVLAALDDPRWQAACFVRMRVTRST